MTSENELNLVIAKNTLLEIYKVAAEGLKFAKQISIWGIIESLKIIRPKVRTTLLCSHHPFSKTSTLLPY